uniref:Uncharacterized protein n=1 Tax=Meloidogyne enterolobii TaxID=390850 RepID=A0A6V7XPI2_MELEN|nr:unnamed protein product [Meloidogyne enterolobii]
MDDQGKQNAGCGNCPDVNFICYDCKESECNSKTNYDKSVKCYVSYGKLATKRVRACNDNKCYVAITIQGDSEEILQKHIRQGCGDCPYVSGQCHTCTEQYCNSEKFYREKFYACFRTADRNHYVVCRRWTDKCYYGENANGRFVGCGTCPDGDHDCFDCNTKNCNTNDNLKKAFRCYESNGKITSIKARKCEKMRCYIASTLKGIISNLLGMCESSIKALSRDQSSSAPVLSYSCLLSRSLFLYLLLISWRDI